MKYILIVILGMMAGCVSNKELPNIGASLTDEKIINAKEYSTYTVFFFAQETTYSENNSVNISALKTSFKSFSTGIGASNLGIWAGSFKDKFSISEGKNLCDKYDLSYNGGPYIIVSRHNPFISNSSENDVVLNFDGINQGRIKHVLNEVEQDIRRGEYNKSGVTEQYKQFILSQYDSNKKFVHDAVKRIIELIESAKKS
jgi:hypothetical protein